MTEKTDSHDNLTADCRPAISLGAVPIAELLARIQAQHEELARTLASAISFASFRLPDLTLAMREVLSIDLSPSIGEILRSQDIAISLAAQHVEELQRVMGLTRHAIEYQAQEFVKIQQMLRKSLNFVTPQLMQFTSPLAAIFANAEVLNRVLADIRSDALSLRVLSLRPVWQLYRFAREVGEGVASEEDGSPTASAAGRAIEAATSETTRTSQLVMSMIQREAASIVADTVPPTLPTFNLFAIQHAEVQALRATRRVDQIDVRALPSTVTAMLARLVCHLITEINSLAEIDGRDPVFKPTNRMIEGASALPFIAAVGQTPFVDFVDLLYQMVYEGSGEAARLTQHLNDDELKPLWTLKHIRTWVVHDVNHGNGPKIAQKRHHIASAFRELIGKPLPETDADYRAAQARLLILIVGALRLLRSRMRGGE